MVTPHIILFMDINCGGNHTHVCESQPYIGGQYNDQTSSFVILAGNWKFFKDAGANGQPGENQMGPNGGVTLGPGVYNWIEAANCLGAGTNDQLSAVQSV